MFQRNELVWRGGEQVSSHHQPLGAEHHPHWLQKDRSFHPLSCSLCTWLNFNRCLCNNQTFWLNILHLVSCNSIIINLHTKTIISDAMSCHACAFSPFSLCELSIHDKLAHSSIALTAARWSGRCSYIHIYIYVTFHWPCRLLQSLYGTASWTPWVRMCSIRQMSNC